MKKLILILSLMLLFPVGCIAETKSDNIELLTKLGFFNQPEQICRQNPKEELKHFFKLHSKYSNNYNIDGLKSLYADNYVDFDGFNKDVYFDLIKKTWESYPDIKYKHKIKNIKINNNKAIVELDEFAEGNSNTKSRIINDFGSLESISTSVYYLEKNRGKWQITSDNVLFEQTFLNYGSAKITPVDFIAPLQISAGKPYTIGLKIIPPKDSFAVGSIAKENITYPQKNSEEIFRKLTENNLLERIVTANDKNINEYAVASFGITKARVSVNQNVDIKVTGVGFAMHRVNVIPKNNFIEVKSEKSK